MSNVLRLGWVISVGQVRRFVALGVLPYFRVGRRVVFSAGDLDGYLAAHRVAAKA